MFNVIWIRASLVFGSKNFDYNFNYLWKPVNVQTVQWYGRTNAYDFMYDVNLLPGWRIHRVIEYYPVRDYCRYSNHKKYEYSYHCIPNVERCVFHFDCQYYPTYINEYRGWLAEQTKQRNIRKYAMSLRYIKKWKKLKFLSTI